MITHLLVCISSPFARINGNVCLVKLWMVKCSLVLTDETRRSAPLDNGSENLTENFYSNATPKLNPLSEPGVAFGQEPLHLTQDGLPNAAPLPSHLVAGTVGAIVLNFKSVTTTTSCILTTHQNDKGCFV